MRRHRTDPTQGVLPIEPHRNHGLFSDHYLERHLERHLPPISPEDSQQLKKKIAVLCQKAIRRATGRKEANVKDVLIRPVLDELGFAYDPEPSIPIAEGTRAADYALFENEERLDSAGKHKGTKEYFTHALALVEAKKWGTNLSATPPRGSGERVRPTHPGAQIRQYLSESGVRWGILTNGQYWRLYELDASRGGQRFYEVDLLAMSSQSDLQAWRYFYLFFRREAFERDAEGRCQLDRWLAESKDYALGLSSRVRENIYEALRFLIEGFFASQGNALHWDRDWKEVHEASLVLLYRLLFILYAEARHLMPLDRPTYRDRYSLQHYKSEIARRIDQGNGYDKFGVSLWTWLRDELFELVNKGNSRMGVPQYNGGLFRPRWSRLDDPQIRLPDYYVAQAIDLLARDKAQKKDQEKGMVDYRELGVRELGSIYEGLLEMRPHLATEPMIVAKRSAKDKQASVIPEAKATGEQKGWNERHGGRRYEPGEVYLLTDRGERKATGSYYTPEYIVNYIVENTLSPLLTDCAQEVAQRKPNIQKKIAAKRKLLREREKLKNAKQRESEVAKLKQAIEREQLALLEPYFELEVLDPAMGSGHFLVGAAEFITDAILTDPSRLPPEDLEGEDEALYYKRRVVERCLYGVDLNLLAVELAKLSLWLHTVQKGRALSFLDHHLRCGNSLIGARIEDDLSKEPPSFKKKRKGVEEGKQQVLGLYETLKGKHLQTLLDSVREIEETPTLDAASERQKGKWYAAMDAARGPFRQVANLWLAPYFGVSVTPEQYQQAVNALRDGRAWRKFEKKPWFEKAQTEVEERRFFHWELEFPEVFFAKDGFKPKDERGFDAVVGNPPYVTTLDANERVLFRRAYRSAQKEIDTYVLFWERTVRVARDCGYAGLIVPSTFLMYHSFSSIRKVLLIDATLCSVVRCGLDVFPESIVEPVVVVLRATVAGPQDNCLVYAVHRRCGLSSEEIFAVQPRLVPLEQWRSAHLLQINVDLDAQGNALLNRVDKISKPMGEICESHEGIHTGNARERLFTKVPDTATCQRLLTGRDIERYLIQWAGHWVRYDDGLIRRDRGQYASLREERIFVEPKIITRAVADRIVAAFDSAAFYTDNVIHLTLLRNTVAEYSYGYLTAILNSILLSWVYGTLVPESGRVYATVKIIYLKRLPIRRIHFTTTKEKRRRLVAEGKKLCESTEPDGYKEFLASDLGCWLDERLPEKPDGSPNFDKEQSDVVHDLLAWLAEQMIEMNKQKQEELKRFLGWLEMEIGHKVDDLRQKTKMRDYHEVGFDTLLGALKANDKLLDRIAHRSQFQNDLRREFDQGMRTLAPLKARIVTADRLIDLIVYRLYGLTEEEVAVVEGE